MTDERKTDVGVLDKIMAILHAFTQGSTTLSPQDISKRTHLPLPTVYRLCQAMSEQGMLEKDGQQFRLGITLMHLGALVAEGIDLRGQTLPHLRWLNEQTSENAELHVRHGEVRIVLETVRSSHSLRPFAAIGAPLPLHLGAAGKVLLAWLPSAERDRLIDSSAIRFTDSQTIDRSTLVKQLEQIQQNGWATSDAERASGVAAIAAPLLNAQARIVGAIALTAPSIRLSAKQRQLFIPLVCEAASRASTDLGYSGPTSFIQKQLQDNA